MGIARGTNIVRDGLVFGYDTGYGLDNFKPTRFYKGKPAVNMLNSGDNFGNWNFTKNSGSDPTVTSNVAAGPFENTLADKLSLPNDGSYPRLYQYFTPASTATHTFSVWLKAQSPNQGVFVGAFRNSPWALPSSTSFTITDEWVNYTFAVNPLDTSSHQIYIGSHDNHKGKEFLIYGAQLETGSSRSTFVDGTRSDTASLIDLKRTTNIDVGDISFDSTGQPDFDGSSDYIGFNHADSPTTNFSYELVIKFDSLPASNSYMSIFQKQTNWNNAGGIMMQFIYNNFRWSYGSDWTGSVSYAQSNFTTGKYYHIVGTVDNIDGDNAKLYVNGVQVSSTGTGSKPNTTANLTIGKGNGGNHNGKIDVFKMYENTITADGVKQNYKAYKNRFNI